MSEREIREILDDDSASEGYKDYLLARLYDDKNAEIRTQKSLMFDVLDNEDDKDILIAMRKDLAYMEQQRDRIWAVICDPERTNERHLS